MFRRRAPLCGLIGILIVPTVWLSGPAFAQTQIPPAVKPGIVEKSLEESQPLFGPPPGEEIPAVILKPGKKKFDAGAGTLFFVKEIKIVGNTLISDEELASVIDVGDGIEVTLGILELFAQDISSLYSSKGYFLSHAYVPRQEVVDGIVKIVVVEGGLGHISVTGNERFKTEDLVAQFEPIREKKVLEERTLESTLLEMNDMLGLDVKSVLKPGNLKGTADMILEVKETKPFIVSFDGDNYGSEFTGKNRFGFTAHWGSAFLFGDRISVRGVKSDANQNFIQPSYFTPLNRLGTAVKFTYTFSDYELGANLTPLSAGGNSNIYSLEFSQLLYRSRNARIILRSGPEFRKFENNILDQLNSKDELLDILVGLRGFFRDQWKARTFYDLQFRFGTTEADSDRQFNSRFDGSGDKVVSSMSLIRYQSAYFLKSYFVGKFTGQLANGRLVSPNQFVVGGMGTVRGYPLAEYSGDDGFLGSLEYVLPFPWKWPASWEKRSLDKALSFVGFIDHGEVFIQDRQISEHDRSITGAGGGIRLSFTKSKTKPIPGFSFAVLYGVPVLNSPDPTDGSNGILYVGGVMSY